MEEKTLLELWEEDDYEELMDRFEFFLRNYCKIFDPRVPTAAIISLSKTNNGIRRTLGYLTHSGQHAEIYAMRRLFHKILPYEDACQAVNLCFIKALRNFDPDKKIPLQKYLFAYFPYLIESEINRVYGPRNILNTNAIIESYDVYELDEFAEDVGRSGLCIDTSYDHDWVSGRACKFPFDQLNTLERKLLVLTYVHGKNQEQVAEEMGYHTSSIKRKKKVILDKLEEILAKEKTSF